MLSQQLKVQQRQEKILSSLDDLTYATRKQLQVVNNLGGDRNAQRILQRMEKDGLIKSARYEMKIYYLSNKGKQQIGSNKGDLKKSQIIHALMRNDLYIQLGMPEDWVKERPVKWGENILIPDATFKKSGEFYFVEIDNKQTMVTNLEKIKKYKELSPVIFKQFNHRPTLIWYTLSKIREQKFKKICEKEDVKSIVYGVMS